MRPPLWVFLHMPKTGGTTFKAHLERYLSWDEQLVEFSDWGRRYRAERDLAEFADRPEEERSRAVVLAGHRLNYGAHRLVPGERDVRYITFLRDPAERCVSLYNFRKSRGTTEADFVSWYRDDFLANEKNSIIGFYASRALPPEMMVDEGTRTQAAKALLERCWHVGFTDRLSASLDSLCAEIGIPADWTDQRVAGSGERLKSPSHPSDGEMIARHVTLSAELRAQIYTDRPEDLALYEWARKAFGTPHD
jgi:hypothetical protein